MGARASAAPPGWSSGYSMLELLFALGLLFVLLAAAVPQTLAAVDEYRGRGAVRYLSGRMARSRMEAITRGVDVGLQFSFDGRHYLTQMCADGDGDGVRAQDIAVGVDPALGPAESLPALFAGVDFGPIKLGGSSILSFSPLGSSSSGSLYVNARGGHAYVIRLFGVTGRIRALAFNRETGEWDPL